MNCIRVFFHVPFIWCPKTFCSYSQMACLQVKARQKFNVCEFGSSFKQSVMLKLGYKFSNGSVNLRFWVCLFYHS